jgi:hypothetical protein
VCDGVRTATQTEWTRPVSYVFQYMLVDTMRQYAMIAADGMFPLFRCARMLMAGGADAPSSWR